MRAGNERTSASLFSSASKIECRVQSHRRHCANTCVAHDTDIELEIRFDIEVTHNFAIKPRCCTSDDRCTHDPALIRIGEKRIIADAPIRTEHTLNEAFVRIKQ